MPTGLMPTGFRQIGPGRRPVAVPRIPLGGGALATAATLGAQYPKASCPVAGRVAVAVPIVAAILVLALRAVA